MLSRRLMLSRILVCSPGSCPLFSNFSAITHPSESAVNDIGDRSKVKDALMTVRHLFKESLRVAKDAAVVFPPLQAVAGGLLTIIEVFEVILSLGKDWTGLIFFQMHVDNNEELGRIKARLMHFRRSTIQYDEPQVLDAPFSRFLLYVSPMLNVFSSNTYLRQLSRERTSTSGGQTGSRLLYWPS